MSKMRLYFTICLLHYCTYIGWSTATINAVSRLCNNPDGRLGRCTSLATCHRYVSGWDGIDSFWPCNNGRGRRPYVCCIFGKRIVFPDDDYDDVFTYTPPTTGISTRYGQNVSPPSGNRGVIVFPNANVNLDTPSPSPASEIGPAAAEVKMLPQRNKMDFLPEPPVCGRMTVGEKIHGGAEAELGEFPWLVNVEYRTVRKHLVIGCAGSILNHRYILTAGHCVKGQIEIDFGKLESVRVGEHNVITQPDCDETECNPPFLRMAIVDSVIHENYYYSPVKIIYNDIALLKTAQMIIYSKSVAPVCLPAVVPALQPPKSGTRLTVAGWGNNGKAEFTYEKRVVDIECMDDEKCHLEDDFSRLCAGGRIGKDSCNGDSGSSLARCAGRSCVIEGIVSYGIGTECGVDKPAVYARIRTFIPWILDHIDEP